MDQHTTPPPKRHHQNATTHRHHLQPSAPLAIKRAPCGHDIRGTDGGAAWQRPQPPAKISRPNLPRGPPLLRITPPASPKRGEEGGGVAVSSPDWRVHQRGGRKGAGHGAKRGEEPPKRRAWTEREVRFAVGSQRACRRLAKVLSSARKGFVVCSRRFGVCSSRSVSQSAGSSGSTCPRRLGRETRQRRLCGGPARLDGELVETRRSSELRSREEDSMALREVATPFHFLWGFCVNDCGRRLSVEVESFKCCRVSVVFGIFILLVCYCALFAFGVLLYVLFV